MNMIKGIFVAAFTLSALSATAQHKEKEQVVIKGNPNVDLSLEETNTTMTQTSKGDVLLYTQSQNIVAERSTNNIKPDNKVLRAKDNHIKYSEDNIPKTQEATQKNYSDK